MRVLVTGHKGYIGAVMTPLLLDAGHEVVGFDSDLFRNCSFGGRQLTEVPELTKDIRDVTVADLKGMDAVIHLAGLSNDPLGFLNPDLTMQINYEASLRLAEFSSAAGVRRFLFSSSCSGYGAAGDDLVGEEAEFHPVTPYGRSKVLVEQAVAKLATEEFSPTFLRNATAYGVSPRLRFDLVLNNLVAWAYTTGRVHIKSDGTPWRPIVHIEDISRAFLAALEAPREIVHNMALNVGRTSENYRIRELAQIVQETVPNCTVEFAEDGGPDKRCYRVNCDKIMTVLPGFRPRWDARRGAQELYEAYCEERLGAADFEGPRYSRISHVKQLQATSQLDPNLRWVSNDATPLPAERAS